MLVLTVLFLGLFGAVALGEVSADVLLVAPLLALVVPLLGGRYVGEDALRRVAVVYAAWRSAPRRRPVAAARPAVRRAPVLVARGGRLVACSHACRPPPALLRTA